MQRKENDKCYTSQESIRIEHCQGIASIIHMCINGDTPEHVGENDTGEKAWQQATSKDHPIPGCAPAQTLVQATEFEGGTAQDESKQNAEHFQVEAAEQGRIPVGESRKKCTSGCNQPDLIPVPEWSY